MNTNHKRPELLQDTVAQLKKTSREISTQASLKAAEARDEAKRHLHDQKSEVVKQITGLNEALRQTAEKVENPYLGDTLSGLADRVEDAAVRLETAELEDVVKAAEDYSRARPDIVLTGCFLLGLGAARFLRAHTPEPQLPAVVAAPTEPQIEPEVAHGHLIGR